MKEFLSTRGVEFESIDVASSATGRARLGKLGFQTVPVVSTGTEGVHGIDLSAVAHLVGVNFDEAPMLDPSELQVRLVLLLEHLQIVVPQLDVDFLDYRAPSRERSMLSLANHVVEIASVFVRVAGGESFDESMANAEPEHLLQPEFLFDRIRQVVKEVGCVDANWTRTVATYFGKQSLHEILDRATWHCAQHLRQLEYWADQRGVPLRNHLKDSDLEGLRLPRDIWDNA